MPALSQCFQSLVSPHLIFLQVFPFLVSFPMESSSHFPLLYYIAEAIFRVPQAIYLTYYMFAIGINVCGDVGDFIAESFVLKTIQHKQEIQLLAV